MKLLRIYIINVIVVDTAIADCSVIGPDNKSQLAGIDLSSRISDYRDLK